jgi:coatomer subunit beta
MFTVYAIHCEFEDLIPNAPKFLQIFLTAESDTICKRNALVFLVCCVMPEVVEWILGVYEQISGLDELLQMSVMEVIQLDCKNDSVHQVIALEARIGIVC